MVLIFILIYFEWRDTKNQQFIVVKSTEDEKTKQTCKDENHSRRKGLEMPKSRDTQIPSVMGIPFLYVCALSFL